MFFFFFKQKTAYEIVSRDWSSDVCSSDLPLFLLPISRCGSDPLFILPISRCGSAPSFYTAHFLLRQRLRFLYCPLLVAAAPPLFILSISRCGSAPAFYIAQFSLWQRPRFLYLPILAAAAPSFLDCPFLVAAAARKSVV